MLLSYVLSSTYCLAQSVMTVAVSFLVAGILGGVGTHHPKLLHEYYYRLKSAAASNL
jgi:hypothetical protein